MAEIATAMRRLETALSRLEAAVALRVEADAGRGDRETELALMDEDRARLAEALDAASAQLAQMNIVTEDVDRRIERAMGTVEQVLQRRASATTNG